MTKQKNELSKLIEQWERRPRKKQKLVKIEMVEVAPMYLDYSIVLRGAEAVKGDDD